MTFQLFQNPTRNHQLRELSNNHQSVKIIPKKDHYFREDLNHQVQLFPDLTVLLEMDNREGVNYRCLKFGYPD